MRSGPNTTRSIVLGKRGTDFLSPYFTAVLSAGKPELCQLLWRTRPMPPPFSGPGLVLQAPVLG